MAASTGAAVAATHAVAARDAESAPSALASPSLRCRCCGAALSETFVDLGVSPLANSYLRAEDLARMEPFHPLRVYVCGSCFLVQLPAAETPDAIFSEYAYFSSYADTWVRHAETYVERMTERLSLDARSLVVEIASNDGYLLQFLTARGIPVLGIEPARNVAAVAQEHGIPTLVEFFGSTLARRLAADGTRADLLIGNNVLAHVPDLNDFVAGLAILLAPDGVLTMEFPHLLRLMADNQFDTIYHEHFSYFSFTTAHRLFDAHGLVLFDVDEIPTHGGSLRIHAQHQRSGRRPATERVAELLAREAARGIGDLETYRAFADRVKETKRTLLDFLIRAKREGRSIACYGAPAKGNTLLNYCGVRTDFIDYTVDRSPHKQGHYLPGTRIPIFAPARIRETRPDYVLILPWNLAPEIEAEHAYIREWGGRFVVPIPTATVLP